MDLPDHVTSVIAIRICKVIQKLEIKMYFSYGQSILVATFE